GVGSTWVGTLGSAIRGALLLVGVHDGGATADQAAVILERGEVYAPAAALKRRDTVADDLGRVGHGGLDRFAQLLERGPRGGWDRPEVGGHRGESFHGAKNSFRLTHARSSLRKRSTASLGPKSSSSYSWRTSISPSVRSALVKRRAYSS